MTGEGGARAKVENKVFLRTSPPTGLGEWLFDPPETNRVRQDEGREDCIPDARTR